MNGLVLTKPRSKGIPGFIQLSLINGEPIITYLDTTRSKRLSIAEQIITFSENQLTENDWLEVGNAVDSDIGYITDLNGTVTSATGYCENTGLNSKEIHLYINNIDHGSIGLFSGGNDISFINTSLNINFNQGDKIRLQAKQGSGTAIQDTLIKLTIHWRS